MSTLRQKFNAALTTAQRFEVILSHLESSGIPPDNSGKEAKMDKAQEIIGDIETALEDLRTAVEVAKSFTGSNTVAAKAETIFLAVEPTLKSICDEIRAHV